MKRGVGITGLGRVQRNLNRAVARIPNKTKAGMKEAALLVQGAAQQVTPHDTGHLKGSAYTGTPRRGANGDLGVEIGYTAAYAPYVHEIDANYRRGQWKFLQEGLRRSAKKVLTILRKSAKV